MLFSCSSKKPQKFQRPRLSSVRRKMADGSSSSKWRLETAPWKAGRRWRRSDWVNCICNHAATMNHCLLPFSACQNVRVIKTIWLYLMCFSIRTKNSCTWLNNTFIAKNCEQLQQFSFTFSLCIANDWTHESEYFVYICPSNLLFVLVIFYNGQVWNLIDGVISVDATCCIQRDKSQLIIPTFLPCLISNSTTVWLGV